MKNRRVAELIDMKQRRAKDIEEFILNAGENGVVTKDICERFKLAASTAGSYLKELVNSGLVTKKEGTYPHVFIWSDKIAKEEPKEEEKTTEEPEIAMGGVDLDVVIPAKNIDQRDVIYASSRSGGGKFFKYLVLTPWTYKATVIGILDEGHPVLDLNSTQFVYIGDDPETGVKMYADLSNVCSRGNKTFGQKITKISVDHMDAVKYFLARYYRIEAKTRDSAGSDFKLKELEGRLKASEGARQKLINDLDRERKHHQEQYKEKCDDYDMLQAEHIARMIEFDDTKKMLTESNENLKSAIEQIDMLQAQLKAKENQPVQQKIDPEYTEKLESTIGNLSIANERLMVETNLQHEHIDTLTKIIFVALKGSKS